MISAAYSPLISVRGSAPLEEYDLFIAALGFEARNTFVASRLPPSLTKLAIAFEDRRVLHFESNQSYFLSHGFEIAEVSDGEVRSLVSETLQRALASDVKRVAVDVSSFSRTRLFAVLSAISEASETGQILVDFWYAPARPPKERSTDPVLITSARPVDPSLSGWASDPSSPLAVIVGVGIERDLALGVAEHLDVAKVWAFVPKGIDPDFDQLAASANAEFFVEDYVVRRSTYDLNSPLDLYTRIESLVFGISRDNRVAIVPLGPKLFAVIALLVALGSDGAVAVWRFSQGTDADTYDAEPAGVCVTLCMNFGGGDLGPEAQ